MKPFRLEKSRRIGRPMRAIVALRGLVTLMFR